MAKAKFQTSLVDQMVNVNGNLLDIHGDGHPYAGQQIRILQRTGKTTYQAEAKDGQLIVIHDGDFNTFDPNKTYHADIEKQRDTINLFTDAKVNQVQQLLPGTIHESPFNPRSNYPADEMEELAESARAVGIMQPVLVRPRGDGSYELVFGHRRYRAARMAHLPFMPAIVRELTDAQSAQLQAVENVQRRDLDPIDEALGYAAFIAAHGISKDELARQIGKSRTHVYNRLKLATLMPDGQAALRAGKLRAEVATLVARVPGEKNQARALALALAGGYAGELKSYRTARAELAEKFMLDLKTALWSLDDATLVASAGACTVCPKRSGVDRLVYADLTDSKTYSNRYDSTPKGENICTDSDCFASKKSTQLKVNQAALEAKGKLVVAGNAARKAVDAYGNVKGDYIPIADMREALKGAKKGTAGPLVTTFTIQDPRSGKTIEVVKRKEAEAAGVKTPAAKQASNRFDWKEHQRTHDAERNVLEAKAKEQTQLNIAMLGKVRVAAATARAELGVFELRLIAQVAIAGVPYYDKTVLLTLYTVDDIEDLQKQLGAMSENQLKTLLLDCALVRNVRTHPHNKSEEPEPMLAAARHHGIDIAAALKACKAEMASAAAAEKKETLTKCGTDAEVTA